MLLPMFLIVSSSVYSAIKEIALITDVVGQLKDKYSEGDSSG
jgi:hypothetical protein